MCNSPGTTHSVHRDYPVVWGSGDDAIRFTINQPGWTCRACGEQWLNHEDALQHDEQIKAYLFTHHANHPSVQRYKARVEKRG
jgi:hypothetical protein